MIPGKDSALSEKRKHRVFRDPYVGLEFLTAGGGLQAFTRARMLPCLRADANCGNHYGDDDNDDDDGPESCYDLYKYSLVFNEFHI